MSMDGLILSGIWNIFGDAFVQWRLLVALAEVSGTKGT
jgi:hypothetical protein